MSNYYNVFIKPELALATKQAQAIRKNVPLIIDAQKAVAKADIAKDAVDKGKTQAFKDELKKEHAGYFAERDAKDHLLAIRYFNEMGITKIEHHEPLLALVSKDIKSMAGYKNAIKTVLKEFDKQFEIVQESADDTENDDDDNQSDDTDAEVVELSTIDKMSIDDLYRKFCNALVENGHTPSEFWNWSASETQEEISTEYTKKAIGM